MKEYQKQILFREFSFLYDVLKISEVSDDRITEVKVKKVDENLLAMTGNVATSYWPYARSGASNYIIAKRYFAIVNNQVTVIPSDTSDDSSIGCRKTKAGTIAEELLKLKLAPDFIVCLDYFIDHLGEEKEYCKLSIFKAKGFDLIDYHANQFKLAAQSLGNELRAAMMK